MYLMESWSLHNRDFRSWVLILGSGLASTYKLSKITCNILHTVYVFVFIFLEKGSIAFLIFSKGSIALKRLRTDLAHPPLSVHLIYR